MVVGGVHRFAKLLLVGSALLLGLAACSSSPSSSTTSSSSSSSTTSSTSAPMVATGSITCSGTGTVTFDPPLAKGGTSISETVTIVIAATACTTSGSNVSKVTGATSTLTIQLASNACSVLGASNAASGTPTWTARWTPSSIENSMVTFSGHQIVTNSAGDVGFVFPNSGGTASVMGSFAGNDNGASSSASSYTDMSAANVLSTCRASGLPSLTGTGTVTLS